MAGLFKRMASAVAPGMMARREISKAQLQSVQKFSSVMNSGYGNHGASTSRKSLKAFTPSASDAKSDIHDNVGVLRARSRDLFMGGALASGSLKAMRTNVVGTGLRLKPTPDGQLLGLSQEQVSDLNRQIKREWELWAETKECDALGMHNFYGLQQLVFLSELMSGDVFGLLFDKEVKFSRYKLRIKVVEADRCETPTVGVNGLSADEAKRIFSGVEVDKDGMVVAYHFAKRHPTAFNIAPMEYQRVPVRGDDSGRRNVLHLMTAERPDQLRGVPILSPVIESLKQLERFTDAELNAAVINSMLTVFVKTAPESEKDDFFALAPNPGNVGNPYNEPIVRQPNEIGLGNGNVEFLEPGEEIQIAESKRPSANFEPFVLAIVRQIGSALEEPYEVILKSFTSSYSASRGALLEAWKMFKMRRTWLASDFCQPVYEEWFTEAVLAGRIDAPGYFDDELIRRAYTKAEWHGPSYGMLDPVKEVQAASMRIAEGLSTGQREAAELTGTDYETNIQQLAAEKKFREMNGLTDVAVNQSVAVVEEEPDDLDTDDDSEDDSDDAGEGGENE